MTVIALGAVKGAPGVSTTTLALASAWPASRDVVVAEADPDGGVLAIRWHLQPEPGMVTLATAIRSGRGALPAHTHVIGAGVRALVAPPAAEQVRAALSVAGDALALAFARGDEDVLADCGRLTTTSPAIAICQHADMTLLMLRPRIDEVVVARHRVAALRQVGVDPSLLLVRDGPYQRDEVATAVEAPVIGEIPFDRRAAQALDDHSGRAPSGRSPLLRSARHLAEALIAPSLALRAGGHG
jgi:MinD-like ATPase involved in chromosome partitioning or flagellar assembly